MAENVGKMMVNSMNSMIFEVSDKLMWWAQGNGNFRMANCKVRWGLKIVEGFDYTMDTSHRQHQQSLTIPLMIWYLNIPNLNSVQSWTQKKLIHTIYLLTPAIGTYERLVMPTYCIAKAKLTTPYRQLKMAGSSQRGGLMEIQDLAIVKQDSPSPI